jgi:hypothetical protein
MIPRRTLSPVWPPSVRYEHQWEGARAMADLAYVVLLIGIFGVLALTLRGLERL